jgi:membrane protease YdiL (CAAX protease family)
LSSPENPQPASDQTISSLPPIELNVPPLLIEPITPAPRNIENPVWSGWDVLQIAGLTLATLFVSELLVGLAVRHFAFPRSSFLEVVQKPTVALLSQLVGYAVVATFMFLLIEVKYRVPFWPTIRWNWPPSVWPWLSIGVMLFVAVGLLGRFLPIPESTPLQEFFKHPRDAYLTSIFAITLGPLMEELFFRGFLYPVLARRIGVGWGIFFTALPFGLMHMVEYGYAWGIVLIIFLVGVVCTAVRARTGSVAASFIVHVAYNATDTLLMMVATGGFRHMEKAGFLVGILKTGTRY